MTGTGWIYNNFMIQYTVCLNNYFYLLVSHRPSLWKYHDWLLEFDGEGHCRFTSISAAADNNTKQSISSMTLEEEKTMITKRISEDEKRLKKINYILGSDTETATQ